MCHPIRPAVEDSPKVSRFECDAVTMALNGKEPSEIARELRCSRDDLLAALLSHGEFRLRYFRVTYETCRQLDLRMADLRAAGARKTSDGWEAARPVSASELALPLWLAMKFRGRILECECDVRRVPCNCPCE